jgi:hypothetical protein
MSAQSFLRRICPWCGVATVYSLTEDGLTRALAAHLGSCAGEQA